MFNKCRFGRLKNFGGLLPTVKNLHQKVLCFSAKVATRTLFGMQ